jgi:hypothetical protein
MDYLLLIPQGLNGAGGSGGGGTPYAYTPLGFFSTASLATVNTLAQIAGGAIPVNATFALVTAVVSDVNWRDDGSDPVGVPGGGHPLYVGGGSLIISGGGLATTKFIQNAAGAVLNVSFYQ